METVITRQDIRRSEIHGASPYECESTTPSFSGAVTVARVFTAPENVVALQTLGPKEISVPSYGVFR